MISCRVEKIEMGRKQKPYGEKKHRNYKIALQKRYHKLVILSLFSYELFSDRMNKSTSEKTKPTGELQILNNVEVSGSSEINLIPHENWTVSKELDNVIAGEYSAQGHNNVIISGCEDDEDSENEIDAAVSMSNNMDTIDNVEESYFEEDLLNDKQSEAEESTKNEIPYGRRIVDILQFVEGVKRLNSHNTANNCNYSNMRLVREFRQGLNSIFTFCCDKCQWSGTIKSNPNSNQQLEINYAAVLGAYAVGIGYYQSQEFLGTLDIPYMAAATYDNRQKLLQNDLREHSQQLKQEAMEKEKQIAIDCNDVDVNGTPLVSAYADGSYPKRSYRTHYDSLSGTACLIGSC